MAQLGGVRNRPQGVGRGGGRGYTRREERLRGPGSGKAAQSRGVPGACGALGRPWMRDGAARRDGFKDAPRVSGCVGPQSLSAPSRPPRGMRLPGRLNCARQGPQEQSSWDGRLPAGVWRPGRPLPARPLRVGMRPPLTGSLRNPPSDAALEGRFPVPATPAFFPVTLGSAAVPRLVSPDHRPRRPEHSTAQRG